MNFPKHDLCLLPCRAGALVIALGVAVALSVAPAMAETPTPAAPATPAEPGKAATPATPAASAQPNIELPETEFKTEAAEGDSVEHIFKVMSSGQGPLTVTDVKIPGGCTASVMSAGGAPLEKGKKLALAPGETCDIKVTFNTKGYAGESRKSITVVSNDPDSPKAEVNLVVNVKQEISVTPSPSVYFTGLVKDQKDTKILEVASASGAPLKITKGESSNPMFVVETKEAQKNKRYTVSISTNPPLNEGSIAGIVTLETTNAKKPKVEIEVSAYVISELAASPKQVIFKGKSEKVKNLYVNGPYTSKELKVDKAESDLTFLTMKVVPVVEGQTYRIEITLGDAAPEEFKGEIKIHSTSKAMPVLTVPVVGQKA